MTSEYDLALFREAQALACQPMEEQLKGLPDVKGTKYIEMGRYEIEVSLRGGGFRSHYFYFIYKIAVLPI